MPELDLESEQQRLREEVQRLREEQQRLRDEQQKVRDQSQSGGGAGAGPNGGSQVNEPPKPEERRPEDPTPAPEKAKGWARRHPLALVVLVIVLLALMIGGFFLWGYLSSYESTDDAQVDGHIGSTSSRISGNVTGVYVDDNQEVKAGQVLVDLDPRDYQVALEQAQAALNQSQAQISAQSPNVPIASTTAETTISTSGTELAAAQSAVAAAQQTYASTLADIREAEANNANAQADALRFKVLVDKDEVSRQQYDQKVTAAKASAATVQARQASADAAQKQIDQAQAQVEQARFRQQEAQHNAPRQVAIQRATVVSRQADAQRARAQVNQALLNLQYCKILAPVSGVVGKKTVEVGNHVSPGQELMAVVPLEDIWITANFKETQLKGMRPGQRVTVHVDAFNRDYEGRLESLAAASGARYSLLPPENATGNYVKVVQRVPVRIRLNDGQNNDRRLRPGMSAVPKVWLQ